MMGKRNHEGSGYWSNEVHERIDYSDWEICSWNDIPKGADVGLIYDRISSPKQDIGGCASRVKTMLDQMEEDDVYLYEKPIIDVYQTGKDFKRQGVQDFLTIADEVPRVYIFNQSRLGRRAAFCLFIIDHLVRDLDKCVITAEGELDLNSVKGMVLTFFSSLSDEIENMNKGRDSLGGQHDNFEDGNWRAVYDLIPVGYQEAPNLLSVDEKQRQAVVEMYQRMADTPPENNYTTIWDPINSKYGDVLTNELDTDRLKRWIRDSVYVGFPFVSGESIGDSGQSRSVDRPDLRLISDRLYEKANQNLRKFEEYHSRRVTSDKVRSLDDWMEDYEILPVIESSDYVTFSCPRHGPMRQVDTTEGEGSHRRPVYFCEDCDDKKYRVFPNDKERFLIRANRWFLDNLDDYFNDLPDSLKE